MAAPTATTSSGLTPLCGSLAEEFFDFLLDSRHTGHTADEDHFADVAIAEAGVFHGFEARLDGPLDEVVAKAFEFGAGEREG